MDSKWWLQLFILSLLHYKVKQVNKKHHLSLQTSLTSQWATTNIKYYQEAN